MVVDDDGNKRTSGQWTHLRGDYDKKLLHLSTWKAKELVLMRRTALSSSDSRYTTGNIKLELPRKVEE